MLSSNRTLDGCALSWYDAAFLVSLHDDDDGVINKWQTHRVHVDISFACRRTPEIKCLPFRIGGSKLLMHVHARKQTFLKGVLEHKPREVDLDGKGNPWISAPIYSRLLPLLLKKDFNTLVNNRNSCCCDYFYVTG